MNKVLAIAVHPDDETLGCGGSLLRHKDEGDKIFWCIVTAISEELEFSANSVKKRAKEIEQVSQLYDFDGVDQLGLPATQLDTIPRKILVNAIADIIQKIKPNILYLPHKHDVHSDHQTVFQAAYSCTKAFRYPFIKRILMTETLSETEFAPATADSVFLPNFFVDISDFIEKKIEILKHFEGEVSKHPFPRSVRNIKALASLRGATVGVEYAEGFMLLREIV
jgi:LmbE family N-acetylglucosaminyl deacetylase